MQGVFNPNILIYHLPNSAEGLHFSAFHITGNKKQFWAFVGRTKCKNKMISSMKGKAGITISSIKDKLQILQQHYQLL